MNSLKFPFSVDPTKISKPLHILAIVLGIIALAFIWAGVNVGQTSFPLGLLTFTSALIISILVIYEFLDILKKTPWVFYSPSDFSSGEFIELMRLLYSKKTEEYKEAQQLSMLAKTTDDIQKTIEKDTSLKEVSFTPELQEKFAEILEGLISERNDYNLINTKITPSDCDIKNFYGFYKSKIEPIQIEDIQRFYRTESDFSKEIAECLYSLSLLFQIEPKLNSNLRPDFIVRKMSGEFIPVEVKNYRQILVGKLLPEKIALQLKSYMHAMNVNESVLIVNSKISDSAKKIIQDVAKPNTVYIIAGEDRMGLKRDLSNIFLK